MKDFGGNWTKQKLEVFINYVKAYLTILNKYKYLKTIYFDGFAGYGKKIIETKHQLGLFDILNADDYREEINVYQGSVSRILSLPKKYQFDWYYFIDTNKTYLDNLEKLKEEITEIQHNRIEIRQGDCNEQLFKVANCLKTEKYAALLFLDPFGMQINWNSIEQFRDTKHCDLWILLPSGVCVNRLLDRNGKLKSSKKLELFFGLPKEEIIRKLYNQDFQANIFENTFSVSKISNPIDKIVEIYTNKLGEIWKYVTRKPLILLNSRNIPIFHFIFASNYKSAYNIASQIIEKSQRYG